MYNNPKTKAILNQLVADLSQFSAVIHQTHWYLRGSGFLTMHPKMDDLMDDVNAQLDEVAERLITVGGAPFSTLGEFAANTRIPDQTGTFEIASDDRLATLVLGYRYLSNVYAEGIRVAGEESDDVSADVFTGAKAGIEKTIWMLEAHLGKAPGL
ncbi:MAG: DNA starvation/stationary phase protection protein [Lactobacillales bacterium]|jgi:starvation-inducible DNA-binding protein|nr:DNA starvation/stationary phase protection protein [Lactobacillales bacterium]